ncbi:hypothetical protein RHS01_05725 [Rhizoctonia solani]|uniref:Uncharacterized protein n=1 Tax=Rhizoctonia solani TaxID=456999 RepID=A0A8H7IDQ8_9AGAM|nr:hypothetical protein RHS01_05725 [Rhizoctonia solani]
MDSMPRQRQQPDTLGTNRRDSTSSFFRPDEYGASGLDYDSTNRRGGGYDRASYIGLDNPRGDIGAAGKDEEWDVFADFNNQGPRYATPFQQDSGYRPIRETAGGSQASAANQVELVTVPALGAEWKASELHDMTKAGRAEARAEERRRKWREFNRDQRGLCGISWAKRTTLVWVIFIVCAVIGILLAILIPRVPSFGFLGDMPLNATSDGGNPHEHKRSDRPPIAFNNIRATIYEVESARQVASGDLGGYTVPAKTYAELKVPVTFSYEAANTSDVTCGFFPFRFLHTVFDTALKGTKFYDACKNKSQVTGGKRPSLQLRLVLELSIAGLIGKPTAGTQINDAACPIELAANAA